MSDLQVGTIQKLTVARNIETGYVLSNGQREVLLHMNEASSEEIEEGAEVEVFLYQDKKSQTVATMTIPTVRLDAFDWAEVVEVKKDLGVFVNIGIQKEILVSSDDLPLWESVWPVKGDELYVALDTDKKGRLIAQPVSENDFDDNFEQAPKELHNKSISGRIIRTDREGAVIITEEGYRGFIHHSERKQEPRLGEWVKGRVIEVKADGAINISLLPRKQEKMGDDAEKILHYLQENGGEMQYGDKSDAEVIMQQFQISKSAFKRALGKLMKEKRIEQKDGITRLRTEREI
ncbi:CvfB family protein [Aquibacillus sediminis]|uniref:CvfB family protein n=1 Tax=Aquibacillus sediminis TaxID=2574734 RepID=UPI001107C0C5|nr:S1-like domain-containing RNA-binding protein [Aquibacillus sediminis]